MKSVLYVTAAAGLLAVFGGCYNGIELEPRQAGDTLPIAGAYNVRDLGGYAAAGGKRIKSGKLIRSGDLNMLTQRDQDYLFGELGVKTVVDFRSNKKIADEDLKVSSEQSGSPDRLPSGVISISETGILESIVVPDYESIISDTAHYPDSSKVIAAVMEGYERIVTGTPDNAKAQYNVFFETLLNSNGEPVLYHCSAGKDRTGVATALLLSVLGVPRETIIRDYLLSAQYVEEKYYPVVPYVIKSTRKSMQERKKLALALAAGGNSAAAAEESLKASMTKTIKQRMMQQMMDNGQEETAAKTAAEVFVESEQGKLQIQAAVIQAKQQMAPLANLSDDWIVDYAQNGGEKIRPLLTVKREYIEAAFGAIEAAYSTSNTPVLDYLTDSTGGLGLTQDNINTLKQLYLE